MKAPRAPEKVRIVVKVEGGVVQGVFCSRPAAVGVIDLDNGEVDEACAKENDHLAEEVETLYEVL